MVIEEIRHKALKRFATKGDRRVMERERLTDMIAFINAAVGFADLATPPNFGFPPLTGNRKGGYTMTVTRNWRLTFTNIDDQTIGDLDLEDYHGD
ncbi:MAG: type II toxin-antitoxin system RelE/ParE family toxin [Novosphingobium sp.]